ncbi:hypothetical protein [Pararhodobacter marinus]|uniref:hypothetical protein n=1 Tax=Pararhodobacter marinus TaxID=2184063 RepID=UPI00351495DA
MRVVLLTLLLALLGANLTPLRALAAPDGAGPMVACGQDGLHSADGAMPDQSMSPGTSCQVGICCVCLPALDPAYGPAPRLIEAVEPPQARIAGPSHPGGTEPPPPRA